MAEDGVFDRSAVRANAPDSSQLIAAIESVMSNSDVTRKGKDKGAVKRALEALLSCLGMGG